MSNLPVTSGSLDYNIHPGGQHPYKGRMYTAEHTPTCLQGIIDKYIVNRYRANHTTVKCILLLFPSSGRCQRDAHLDEHIEVITLGEM
jgi:hypothetical protein